jgi:hypothetical protein
MVLVPLHHTILVQEYGHVLLGFYGRLRDAIKFFPSSAGSWFQREAGNLKRIFE